MQADRIPDWTTSSRREDSARPLRVCLLSVEIFAWGKIGGYGRATRFLGRELVRRGIDVTAIVPRRGNQRPEEMLDGIRVLSFPLSKPWQAVPLLRAADADIYHSQEPWLATYLAKQALPHRRHIVTVRDPKVMREWLVEVMNPSSHWLRTAGSRLYDLNPLVKGAVRRADAVLTVAHFTIEKARRLYGLSQNPRFLPTPIPIPETMPEKASTPTVCFVGRLDPRKRPRLFLDLAEQFPAVRFVAVGGSHRPEHETDMRSRYGHLANLELTGFIDQFRDDRLERKLGGSWILVNTSLREGLPTAFLEALGQGCALLGALNPDGLTERFGRLVDEQGFADGLRWLLADERWRRLGEQGHRHVLADYSTDISVRRHLNLYTQLAETRHR